MNFFKFYKYFLYLLPAETAHNFAILILKLNLLPKADNFTDKSLETNLANMIFLNPVGLAAGFDKNAECLLALSKQNFGFLEAGSVTPRSKPGNEKPRIFRF